jgi:4-hydroxybenzoate polyprenyltransferase
MGVAYGLEGPKNLFFLIDPLMTLQMVFLSFPMCFFVFGLNDIQDFSADILNPRKTKLEGFILHSHSQKTVRKIALLFAAIFLFISVVSKNLLNFYFSITFLVVSYTYSVPPWRLKTRPPLDAVAGGIIGFFAPFGLGYSFAGETRFFPLQAFYFTFCVMGFHAFSTIMDYEADKQAGDRTFAVAYGKRAAALIPALITSPGPLVVHSGFVKIFFLFCSLLFFFVFCYPSEKLARYFFLVIYATSFSTLVVWLVPRMFGGLI